MLIPITWLKEYIDIKLPLKELMWKMTEVGLTCESYKKDGDEIILDVEVTANRPDWMSIIGVAREVAAIQETKLNDIKIKDIPTQTAKFPIDLEIDFELFPRWSAVIIKDIEIKQSPVWLAERIKLMGHEPINNIIDITNYVMYELGIPMHAFDYDEIYGQIMSVKKSQGGENFTSVDGVSYKLPPNAIIIEDSERIIDLAGIKGGQNSGIKNRTKNILLHTTINNPVLVRRTSLAMGLRSDASAIYERGPDVGGTVRSLKRAINLILQCAGGEIASEIIDIKRTEFKPKKITLNYNHLEKILGIKIPENKIFNILSSLNLNPKNISDGVDCLIPTYRSDIKIEEDLAEEVARIYGYNKFPLTIPEGTVCVKKIPYYFDDTQIHKIKNMLVSSGYTEAKTLSLISKDLIEKFLLDTKNHIRILNPVSIDYSFMRTSLIPTLFSAVTINHDENVSFFEVDKVYLKTGKGFEEKYKLALISTDASFRSFKSIIELILERLNIENYSIDFETQTPFMHQSNAGILRVNTNNLGEFGELNPSVVANLEYGQKVYCSEIDIETLLKLSKLKLFTDVPQNPSQVEDLTITFPAKTRIGEVINSIKSVSKLISKTELKDIYNEAYTFRIEYQDTEKTLTNIEVEQIRNVIIETVKRRFGGIIKS